MPLDKLDVWLQGRASAAASNVSVFDRFVTAVVTGPVSMDPPEWICPLLGIEIGTPEFAAISAVGVRHNAISQTLSTAPNITVNPWPASRLDELMPWAWAAKHSANRRAA